MARLGSSPPRRITRSSLARFAYTNASDTTKPPPSRGNAEPSPDIEDAIPDTTPPASGAARKRKRTTTVSSVAAASSSALASRRRTKREIDDDDDDADVKLELKSEATSTKTMTTTTTTTTTTPTKTPRRARKPARTTTDPATGQRTTSPPADWEEVYDVVRTMRRAGGAACPAPVDTMGCERLALSTASPRDQRFQTLVALMLSSQTKDAVNAAAMRRLQTELPAHAPGAPPGLTLENLLAAPPETLNELIWAVGFHNTKTRYLQAAAALCRDRHAGDIPDSVAGLVALPGVGPKMAHLCLSAAWGRTEGIGVDVHVHRITNLWGWHGGGGGGGSKNPEDTRLRLESWLPKDRWREVNTLLVGLGQTVCLPVGRRCGDCELGLRGLCRAADRKKVLEGRRARDSVKAEAEAEVEAKGEGEVKTEEKEEEKEEVKEEVKGEDKEKEEVKTEGKEEEEEVEGMVKVEGESTTEVVVKNGEEVKLEEGGGDDDMVLVKKEEEDDGT